MFEESAASDSEVSDNEGLKINKRFAKQYVERKQKQDLQKARQMGLIGSDDESSSEEEDEDGGHLTAALQANVLETLHMIKTKDPKIYDPKNKFFDGPIEMDLAKKSKNEKKTFKDLERERVMEAMENDGIMKDDEEHERDQMEDFTPAENKSYFETQRDAKMALKKALADDSDEEEDDFFQTRAKTNEEIEAEKEMISKAADKAIDESDDFLRDYVKNEGWKVDEDEFTEDTDEEDVKKAEEFEQEYNFRFEDPEGGVIKGYSRVIKDSMRRRDNKRKRQRDAKKKRKQEEKLNHIAELKRLRELRKNAVAAREEAIAKVSGLEEIDGKILSDDFDPEAHEKMMQKLFNDEYYEADDEDMNADSDDEAVMEKPKLDDLMNMPGMEDLKADLEEIEAGSDSEDDDSDDEQEENDDEDEPAKKSESLRKAAPGRRRKKGLHSHSLEEIMDRDFEDIVAGQPVRFKYRSVKDSDFGISTDEILEAEDRILNQFVPLKKLAPYRDEEWEAMHGAKKRFKYNLKKQRELEEEKAKEASEPQKSKKSKKKSKKDSKKRKSEEGEEEKEEVIENKEENEIVEEEEKESEDKTEKKKSKKSRRKRNKSKKTSDKSNEG
eukprot:TRINITY_DN4146_c0_g1_i1.p1 TRINITY_DN4146_c0_g1~~TRINITY_DN4146_c0_g1_i1.p1  ORF type:complete len:611 (+),score=328.22 TRINITY_DN4146_c0_g1_i1:34-1866(+)